MKKNYNYNGAAVMKTLSKILAYTICLQLTVGSYPILNQQAYAQDDKVVDVSEDENSGPSRGPASQNLNMSATEVADNSRNYIQNFTEQCVDQKGEIKENVAFVHDKEIGSEEPRMYNCAAAAEVIQKVIVPGMNDVVEEAKNTKANPNCPTCGISNQDLGGVNGGSEGAASCSAAEQKKFAKEECSFGCNILATVSMQDASCPKSSGVTGKCFLEIGKGIAKGIWDILTFIPKLIWDGVKWGWKKLFGETENKTSEKAHALSNLSNKEIKQGKENPEALKQTFLQKIGNFFKEFGKAVTGYDVYEEKAKCTDCTGKADLMCGVIGNTGGFLMTLFGNGLIFGATKGLGTKIAAKVLKFSKGSSKLAKFTSKSIAVAEKTGKYVAKPFIGFGNIIVKGASKVSSTTIKWWDKFKDGKLYSNITKFKNTGVYKKVAKVGEIPKKITLKIGRGIGKGFEKMGAFEDRMFMKGVGLTNKELKTTMLRAQNINKLRAARLEGETAKTGSSAATNETLRGVDELKVVKDASEGRSAEQWVDLKKKASNELSGVKVKNLDDIENANIAEFDINPIKEKSLIVETSKGPREVKFAKPADVESIHTYQDGKYAVIKSRDGSYVIHDLDAGSHLTQVQKGKEEFVEALLGKKTKSFDDLESLSYEQVKTNMKINETKFSEEIDVSGNKSLKIETPNGCNPKVLTFGVDKAI